MADKLRALGLSEDQSGPICRWKVPASTGSIKLDVMPVDGNILGFTNRWYKDAIRTANDYHLADGIQIKVVSPLYFMATKFEAFSDRGQGNFFSHDLEDIVFLLENREGLIQQMMDAPYELKCYFAGMASCLLNDEFLNVLPGLLNNPDSARAVTNALKIMSDWKGRD